MYGEQELLGLYYEETMQRIMDMARLSTDEQDHVADLMRRYDLVDEDMMMRAFKKSCRDSRLRPEGYWLYIFKQYL